MKGIMYHYVRPFDEKLSKLKHLHIDDFRRQLDYFQQHYGFVEKEKFLDLFTNKDINNTLHRGE